MQALPDVEIFKHRLHPAVGLKKEYVITGHMLL